jgi:hypothetical protein
VTALRAYRGRIPPLTGTITVDASIDQTFPSFTDSFASWWPFLNLSSAPPNTIQGMPTT